MKDHSVTIVSDSEADIYSNLKSILAASGFWDLLNNKCNEKGVSKSEFHVLIKPDFDIYEPGGTTGIDPALVEYWIDLLVLNGFTKIAVAASDHSSGSWLDNREALVLADLIGYKYETKEGATYDILSLSENLVNANFDSSSILHESQLSMHWLNADFRILLSKNKTDEEFFYSLSIQNLIDTLPLKNKDFHYYFRMNPGEVALALLERNEVDFCLIDAYVSNHGLQGVRHTNPINTYTFIASTSVLLADWAGSLKMGLDPYLSTINAYALRRKNLSTNYVINGSLAVYEGWKNVPRLLANSVQERNKSQVVKQLAKAWLQTVDTSLFPFRNVADTQINKVISPIAKDMDQHPLAYACLILFNHMLANVNKFTESYQMLYDKEKLFRKETELGFDPSIYTSQDFKEIENYVLQLSAIATSSVADRNGLKWRYLDDSIVFEYIRTLPYGFNDFSKKVDISQSVQYMFDNIGGTRVVVKENAQGQSIHQAERDIYLPQPNWMVLFGGKFIDVCKIEAISYEENRTAICWRTVKTLNDSADYDDGMISFSYAAENVTEIKIIARQKFTLPLFWQVVNIDYLEKLKSTLVSDSYITFLAKTIANLEAVYEGRNPKIGRLPDPTWGESSPANHPFQADQIQNLLGIVSSIFEKWISKNTPGQKGELGSITDENGFRHFSGAVEQSGKPEQAIRSFITDFTKSIQKDIALATRNT